uniref:Cytochrome P450 monooxygenase n=1 Tax=Panonychus citri TaxID=50023 RepID=A0A0U1WZ83_PANCT|nr:cytochrome P450 monooxygenase [Panonychus citri]
MSTTTPLTPNQLIFLFITSLIGLVVFYVKRKHSFWERQNVKGPKPIFIVGNIFENMKTSLPELYSKYYKKYGKVFGTYYGLQHNLHIGDSELLRNICVKDFNVFQSGFQSVYVHPIEENSLINLIGPKWKRMRSMLSPTFTSGKMKKMFKIIKSCTQDAQIALTKLSKKDNGAFEPKTFWGRYNTDVIAKCCFAANLDVYSDEASTLQRVFHELFDAQLARILFIFLAPEWLTKAARIANVPTKNLEYLRDLTLALIEKRKNEKEKVEDFLQILIDSGSSEDNNNGKDDSKVKFTPEEIVSSSVIFLLAGFETTSTLLTWACYRLALNPNIQEKLFNEVSKADIQDYDVLSGLTYLDAVINESLRIDPPIIIFQRTAHEDYTLPGTNIFIPKHTRVTIPVYAIHHDPDNYSDPEEFKPERFINESPKPFTFLPFGAGPRICIGMRFALINAKLSLATLVQNYKILPTRETPTPKSLSHAKGSLVLSTKSLKLKIEPR